MELLNKLLLARWNVLELLVLIVAAGFFQNGDWLIGFLICVVGSIIVLIAMGIRRQIEKKEELRHGDDWKWKAMVRAGKIYEAAVTHNKIHNCMLYKSLEAINEYARLIGR